MKYGILHVLLLVSTLALLTLTGGCTVTPHANLGVGLERRGGSFQVVPRVGIGVHGRP